MKKYVRQNFSELVIHEIDSFLWTSWMYNLQLNFPEKPFFPHNSRN